MRELKRDIVKAIAGCFIISVSSNIVTEGPLSTSSFQFLNSICDRCHRVDWSGVYVCRESLFIIRETLDPFSIGKLIFARDRERYEERVISRSLIETFFLLPLRDISRPLIRQGSVSKESRALF